MNNNNFIKITTAFTLFFFALGCTKLDQKLQSNLTTGQAANAFSAQLFLQTAYNDVGNPYSDPGNIFALEEVTADMCVVPTRAGDWDDNGKWRALKKQTFTSEGVDIIENMFTALNKLNFDATNVLNFKPNPQQAAEARFLRALSLYQLLDLYGQFPFRQPGENLLNAPKVYSGEEGYQFIVSELTTILPDLPATSTKDKVNKDVANFLLMKLYLNHGAFVNRATPTFDNTDMQNVISIGSAMIASGRYAYNANYFDNFNPKNSTASESIYACPNTSGVSTNNTRIDNRWWATLHYNSYSKFKPQAGWNGFSTVADFYNSFGITTTPTHTLADSALDSRIGQRYYPGCTNISGIRPGLLIGQQYDENGVALNDRQGNPLVFDPNIVNDLKETGPTLEDKGIRVVKYVPDFSNDGANYTVSAGNWLILFRYPDVVLMVAEAKMRATSPDNAGALSLVNALRAARSAAPLASMTLVDPTNVAAPSTLLAERGRELYWEVMRRTDLIRFGVFQKAWSLKPASDATHLLFPIPPTALAANPNLKQNDGY
jgi:hypothetical protein